jgi:ferredoxin
MPTLHIDGATIEAPEGASIFDCAESVDVAIPTSCLKNGKCRECLVEIEAGADLLSPRSEEERHLTDRFRLSASRCALRKPRRCIPAAMRAGRSSTCCKPR